MTPPARSPEPPPERMTQAQLRRIRRDNDLADMKDKVAAGRLIIRTMGPSELFEAQKQAAARREQVKRDRR
jgi:hypothetical protein